MIAAGRVCSAHRILVMLSPFDHAKAGSAKHLALERELTGVRRPAPREAPRDHVGWRLAPPNGSRKTGMRVRAANSGLAWGVNQDGFVIGGCLPLPASSTMLPMAPTQNNAGHTNNARMKKTGSSGTPTLSQKSSPKQ